MSTPEKKPAKALPRVAIDLRRAGQKWQMVEVTYAEGQCKERVAYESESGPLTAEAFFKEARRRSHIAVTGVGE